MASKRKSTLEKISELLTPAPEIGSDDDLDLDTKAKVIEDFEDEFSDNEKPRRPSLKQSSALDDDPRYTGRRVTRRDACIAEDSGNESSEASSEEQVSDEGFSDSGRDFKSSGVEADSNAEDHSDKEDQYLSDEEFDESEDYGSEGEGESDHDEYSIMETEEAKKKISEQTDTSFKHISSVKDVQSEIEKGKAVKNQLNIWDNLLECRINLQKCLIPANRLPKYQNIGAFVQEGGAEFASEIKKTQHGVKKLLNKFMELQETLINNFSETKNLGKKANKEKNESDEEIPSDSELENEQVPESLEVKPPKKKKLRLDDYETVLNSDHKHYTEFRDATIQKWNDRTRVITGKISSRDFSAFEQSTVQQIRHILSNRTRLVQRTRVHRSVGPILGEPEAADIASQPDHDPEIFDDSDFYQQLLRELIERRTDETQDSVALGKRWAALQKLRTKMKKRVDTKATKGRRLRYDPHQKLVGYMAPIMSPVEWNEKAITELFSSLFGKKV